MQITLIDDRAIKLIPQNPGEKAWLKSFYETLDEKLLSFCCVEDDYKHPNDISWQDMEYFTLHRSEL
jgi:hypothetical protein